MYVCMGDRTINVKVYPSVCIERYFFLDMLNSYYMLGLLETCAKETCGR